MSTIINAVLLNVFFKRYLSAKYYALGFILFIAFYGLTLEVDLMRNIKALLIFLIALRFVEERKPIQYFLLISLAFFFHWSALFFIPLYFFLHKPISLRTFIVVLVIGNLIFIFNIQITYLLHLNIKLRAFAQKNLFSERNGPFDIGFEATEVQYLCR